MAHSVGRCPDLYPLYLTGKPLPRWILPSLPDLAESYGLERGIGAEKREQARKPLRDFRFFPDSYGLIRLIEFPEGEKPI